MYILIAGNLTEGHRFIGPFESFEKAADHECHLEAGGDRVWPTWIVELESVEHE
jgi:hypothetical protein